MECEDCNKKIANKIIFSTDVFRFFAVCEDCIGENDYVCPDGLIKNMVEQ